MTELSIEKIEMVSGGGWYQRTDACFGKFHNLTGSNIANWAILSVFNGATLGGYSVSSLAVCGAYGAFSS